MIEYALLIMLGFCTAGLIAFLLAPTLWRRAVRLTTKRLEATLPMSLSEIEADKDLLRASYAIKIRRLEAGLNKARDKSATQLVEISKHQVRIAELNQRVAELSGELEERRNAANVFEGTIRKRFPELEAMLATASAALDERAAEIADLTVKLRRREEALELTQRSGLLQQDEIRKLRDTLERTGADITGRFKKRPAQWGLDEYRAEYDRLNGELSKMREQLILAQDREKRQIAVLKSELQNLAERIMSSATEQRSAELREPDRPSAARIEATPSRPAVPPRAPAVSPPVSPRGWTSGPARGTRVSSRMISEAARAKPAESVAPKPETAKSSEPEASIATPVAPDRNVAGVTEASAAGSEDAARNALKSLLDRGARLAGRELLEKAEKAAQGIAANGDSEAEKARTVAEGAAAAAAAQMSPTAEPAASAESSSSQPANEEAPKEPARAQPQLDRVFREIIEGRPAVPPAAPASAPASVEMATSEATSGERAEGESVAAGGDSKTKTLLDRLRHIQERQTG